MCPKISEIRLSISPEGRVRYQLKMPLRNEATHVKWGRWAFIAKLVALVPPPRAHLTRFPPAIRLEHNPARATSRDRNTFWTSRTWIRKGTILLDRPCVLAQVRQ